jgi:hypothetical protein
MTVKELIEKLKECDPHSRVFVDWDREGANENEVSRIEPFNPNYDKTQPKDIALR